jgi:hypothetical protein
MVCLPRRLWQAVLEAAPPDSPAQARPADLEDALRRIQTAVGPEHADG